MRNKDLEHDHKVKSEISYKDGTLKKEFVDFNIYSDKVIKRLMKKYRGKISTDAMFIILVNNAYYHCNFEKSMSAKFK